MPIRGSLEGRLTWKPCEKPKAIMPWLIGAVSHREVGLPGARVAAVVADRSNDKTGGCWMKSEPMAVLTNVSESAVKAGLQQLDDAGLIIRVEEVIRGKRMRVIYPCMNGVIESPAPRAARGGVPQGVDLKKRAAEKASANTVSATGTQAVSTPVASSSKGREPIATLNFQAGMTLAPVFGADDPGSWSAIMAGAGVRPAGTDLRSTRVTDLRASEGTDLQSSMRSVGQSRQGSAGQTPCILEKSIDRYPDQIQPPGTISQNQSVFQAMCVHRDCRTLARFVCTATGAHYCIRHRGTAAMWEEIS